MTEDGDDGLVGVRVVITHFAENYPPGIVACEFQDCTDRVRKFEVKFYDVSDANLDDESVYPAPGVLGCKIRSRSQNAAGRAVVEIETDWPTTDGHDTFLIYADQLAADVTQVYRTARN